MLLFIQQPIQPITHDDNFQKYFNGNVIATYNLIEACNIINLKKIIFSSSFSVYGKT